MEWGGCILWSRSNVSPVCTWLHKCSLLWSMMMMLQFTYSDVRSNTAVTLLSWLKCAAQTQLWPSTAPFFWSQSAWQSYEVSPVEGKMLCYYIIMYHTVFEICNRLLSFWREISASLRSKHLRLVWWDGGWGVCLVFSGRDSCPLLFRTFFLYIFHLPASCRWSYDN